MAFLYEYLILKYVMGCGRIKRGWQQDSRLQPVGVVQTHICIRLSTFDGALRLRTITSADLSLSTKCWAICNELHVGLHSTLWTIDLQPLAYLRYLNCWWWKYVVDRWRQFYLFCLSIPHPTQRPQIFTDILCYGLTFTTPIVLHRPSWFHLTPCTR